MLIRKGKKEDIGSLLHLIMELAEYEKAPNEVVITANELMEDCFGDKPIFNFYVAEYEGKIIGIALYYIKYSTWKGKCVFLEDIIVSEPYRQMGAGKKLFDAVVFDAQQLKVKRLEWQVLEWNKPAIGFYKKLNANFDDEWINCKLTQEQIESYFD